MNLKNIIFNNSPQTLASVYIYIYVVAQLLNNFSTKYFPYHSYLVIEDVPSVVKYSSSVVEDIPSAIEDVPPIVEDIPSAIEDISPVIKDIPPVIKDNSSVIEDTPLGIDNSSSAIKNMLLFAPVPIAIGIG